MVAVEKKKPDMGVALSDFLGPATSKILLRYQLRKV